jgi:hypothetical protein
MKTKRFYIWIIGLMLTTSLYAERTDMTEKTENWLQKNRSETGGFIEPGTEPTMAEPSIEGGPVGDSLLLLVGLGLTYSLCVYRKKVAVK